MSQDSAGMHDPTRSRTPPRPVDNTDWLKTVAIICVSAGHFGFFFMDDEQWWSVFGRFAAPPFFFLVGYAQSRTVPLHWIWIGVILTLLESSNADWTWVAPNILLSLALIRLARPYVQMLVQRHGWAAFVLLVSTFLAGAADSGEDRRLRRGGVVVGAVRLMPAPICRWHIRRRQRRRNSTLVSIRVGCDPDRRPDAASGLPWSLRSSSSGRSKRSSRFRQFIWLSLFWASAFCRSACVYSSVARAASNLRRK